MPMTQERVCELEESLVKTIQRKKQREKKLEKWAELQKLIK